ncbi:MAG: peptidylprolyl isomerase [Planctomycetota bacterium]
MQRFFVCAGVGAVFGGAQAQSIEAVSKYVGVDRAVLVEVGFEGNAGRVLLIDPSNEVVAAAAIDPGEVDLAESFPLLWDRWDDDAVLGSVIEEEPEVLYAQLEVDGERAGSALVLQPLLTPASAQNTPGGVEFSPRVYGRVIYSGLRIYTETHVIVETSEGTLEFQMRPDEAPNTVYSFLELSGNGYYDGVIFHRILNSGQSGRFVIQGGDPTGTGTGGPGFFIDLEDSELPHDFGVISMARSGDPDSNGSQFFVCLSRPGTSFLDGRYTAFGRAVGGAEVINAIAETPVAADGSGRPDDAPMITSTRLIPAPSRGSAPAPVTNPTDAGEE